MIKLGYHPTYVKLVEELIRTKNVDIVSLRKQLKLPSIEYPEAKEIGQLEMEKENIFKTIIEQNMQIEKMETEAEKLLKEK